MSRWSRDPTSTGDALPRGARPDARRHGTVVPRLRRRAPALAAALRAACYPAAPLPFYDPDTPEALRDDVPRVLHLGRLVRDDGHVPAADAEVFRTTKRACLRHHGACGDGVAILHRAGCRPVLRDRAHPRLPASAGRRAPVLRLDADRFRPLLRHAGRLCPVLHADAGADEFAVVPSDERSRQRIPARSGPGARSGGSRRGMSSATSTSRPWRRSSISPLPPRWRSGCSR